MLNVLGERKNQANHTLVENEAPRDDEDEDRVIFTHGRFSSI